jgi:hypothetical protein
MCNGIVDKEGKTIRKRQMAIQIRICMNVVQLTVEKLESTF